MASLGPGTGKHACPGGHHRAGRLCDGLFGTPEMRLGALRKLAAPPYSFTHLRTRLVVLYAALFTLSLIGVAVVAQIMIWGHARESVRAELVASGTVYDRIWALRAKSLAGS